MLPATKNQQNYVEQEALYSALQASFLAPMKKFLQDYYFVCQQQERSEDNCRNELRGGRDQSRRKLKQFSRSSSITIRFLEVQVAKMTQRDARKATFLQLFSIILKKIDMMLAFITFHNVCGSKKCSFGYLINVPNQMESFPSHVEH